MEKLLLLGAEAIAQGAIDGGMSGIYAYPGTPSTEITEYVQKSKLAKDKKIHSQWSSNEKTAMEAALGMSYAGKRAMVCMKHVGLNVAADPFINSAITGVNGGLIITVADDPSMHSSQNEQDSRYLGKFAMIPMFEPSNQQEAYDMARDGFIVSEKYKTPVLIRITTRLSHSRYGIQRKELVKENNLTLPEDPKQFVLLPAIAKNRYKILLNNQKNFAAASESSPFNKYIEGNDKSLGIVACGIAYNYLLENFPKHTCIYPVVKIGQYPVPQKLIKRLNTECNELLVLEDGYPFVEETLKGFFDSGKIIHGRLDGSLPRDGELNPTLIALALSFKTKEGLPVPEIVANRPPELCSGCSHRDVYEALNEAMKPYGEKRVFSDIGCYTLGALPPFNSINSCVDMGASITMAKGAADAGLVPSVAVIGDSTFTHSGITGLLDAVNENSSVTIIISDNSAVAMTGGQNSAATGKIKNICLGLGVEQEHVRILTPLPKNHDEMVRVMKEELAFNGVSVIIAQRECIQTFSQKKKESKK